MQQYRPPRFDIHDATSAGVAITVENDSYRVDAGSTTRIPLGDILPAVHGGASRTAGGIFAGLRYNLFSRGERPAF